MNKEEIRALVAQMLGDLSKETSGKVGNSLSRESSTKVGNYSSPEFSGNVGSYSTQEYPARIGNNPSAEFLTNVGYYPTSEPPVKAGDYRPTDPKRGEEALEDLSQTDLRKVYHVENPKDAKGFLLLREKTPARLGVGRAGPRYPTKSMLRFRADHAAARDSVFRIIGDDFAKAHGLIPLKTRCVDKDQYLTRPDLGRTFDDSTQKLLSETWQKPQVMIVIGDGLSSAAIEANAMDCTAAILQGLRNAGISVDKIPFIQYCRVGASDHIGDLTGCELLCLLIGERPGLVTAESMSAYITYRPYRGIPEAKRTVISNIHKGGITAVEAGAHIASLLLTMLKQKASGLDLKPEGQYER